MGNLDRKQSLFDAIVRLRRVERRLAPDADVLAVRSLLEDELGDTVSRRFAARVLGVDHKALDRWVRSGDLPLVRTVEGRQEVPLPSLLELHEAVEATRANGSRSRHHLEPALTSGRKRAEKMRPRELVGSSADDGHGHGRAERRSLAYHRALAEQLRRRMVHDARLRLWKWREQGRVDERYAEQWEDVLSLPLANLREVIGEDSQRGRDLRQNSPFAGMLSEAERRRINEEID